jgi:hypothetical protein
VLRYKDPSSGSDEARGDEAAELIGEAYVHGLMDLKSTPRGEDEYFTIG